MVRIGWVFGICLWQCNPCEAQIGKHCIYNRLGSIPIQALFTITIFGSQLNKKISIVVPVYNESGNIYPLYERISTVIAGFSQYDWQLLFVNDGSGDNSWEVLSRLATSQANIKVVDLSRNFGKEVALSAGFHEAGEADAVICLDADLQHPPELFAELIAAWEAGAEMVITIRAGSLNESLFRKWGSSLYYWFINRISNVVITPKSTDFRLFDKKVVTEFLRMTERNRMFRGIMDWMGFKRAYVSFYADSRLLGESTFSLRRLMGLAVSSVMSFSLWPLRLTGYLGLLITLVSGLVFLWMIVNFFIKSAWVYTPLAMAIVANTFLIGIVLSSIGLVALYIGAIHIEVINRPLYLVRERIQSPKEGEQ